LQRGHSQHRQFYLFEVDKCSFKTTDRSDIAKLCKTVHLSFLQSAPQTRCSWQDGKELRTFIQVVWLTTVSSRTRRLPPAAGGSLCGTNFIIMWYAVLLLVCYIIRSIRRFSKSYFYVPFYRGLSVVGMQRVPLISKACNTRRRRR